MYDAFWWKGVVSNMTDMTLLVKNFIWFHFVPVCIIFLYFMLSLQSILLRSAEQYVMVSMKPTVTSIDRQPCG